MKNQHETNELFQCWYKHSFGNLYQTVYATRTDAQAEQEIDQLVRRLQLTNEQIIDVCCGNGRHLQILRKRGFNAVGVDLSACLLDSAIEREGIAERLIQGDIRQLPFKPLFDVCLNLFTSFGYFSDEENETAFKEMTRLLKPEGILVIDHINRAQLEKTLIGESEQCDNNRRICIKRWINGNRVEKQITIPIENASPQVFYESVRMYTPEELIGIAARNGLINIKFLGDYKGSPFDQASLRMIFIGFKGACHG